MQVRARARLYRLGLALVAGLVLAGPTLAAEGEADDPGSNPETVDFINLDAVIDTPSEESAPPSEDIPALRPEGELVPVQLAGPFEHPWAIAFLPEGGLLVTERAGRLRFVDLDNETYEVAGVPEVLSVEHAGLLDIALDPDFAANRMLYLSYTHGSSEASTMRVLKARLADDSKSLVEQTMLFESFPPASTTQQLGGRMAVSPEGFLFLSLGDRWEPARAQDISDDAGSIIRIRTDGSIPEDNPLVLNPEARPGLWSWGHRNPQGLAFEPGTNRLWATEHGPQGGDELNIIESGRNYGWPLITYGINYDGTPVSEEETHEGLEQPVHYWVPSIAPSGLALLWHDHRTTAFVGALAGQKIVRLEIDGDRVVSEQEMLKETFGRIRDVRIGPDERIYFVTDDPEGFLWRLDPAIEQVIRDGNDRL